MRPRPAVVAIVSDLHVGSTVALCPPTGIQLEDGGRYQPSKLQTWIWQAWLDYWHEVYELCDREKASLIVIVNGEFVDGNHHGTTQIGSPAPGAMEAAAVEVFEQAGILKAADMLYATKGSAAHTGPGGRSDQTVAKALHCQRDPETGQNAFYQLLLDVLHVRFDIAHHISASTRPWTKGTSIRGEVLMAMLDNTDKRAPDLVIRSHVHVYADTGSSFSTRGFITPAWQLKTEFAHKVTRSLQRTVGGLIVTVRPNQPAQVMPWLKSLHPAPVIRAV